MNNQLITPTEHEALPVEEKANYRLVIRLNKTSGYSPAIFKSEFYVDDADLMYAPIIPIKDELTVTRVVVTDNNFKIHSLKTWPEYYHEVWIGNKRFEMRKNDRDFEKGDCLRLEEWNPQTQAYTGKQMSFKIDYLLTGEQFGVMNGFVCMSISPYKF